MPAALYYMHDPFAPIPNKPSRFGSAVVIEADGKILLEHRKDNFRWGIVSGDIRSTETFRQCAIRRTIEETGIHIKNDDLKDLDLFDDPTRIVSFHEGNVYRLVHFAYYVRYQSAPKTEVGTGSIELRWVDPMELEDYHIVVAHQDILEEYFEKHNIQNTMRRSIREQ